MRAILIFVFSINMIQLFGQPKLVEPDSLTRPIFCSRFLNNQTIAFSGPDSLVYFLNLSKLKLGRSVKGLRGVPDVFEFTPNGKWIVATTVDNEIGCWKLKPRKLTYSLGEYFHGYYTSKSIQFKPDQTAFSVFQNCNFPIWNLADGKVLDSVKALPDECAYNMVYGATKGDVICIGNSAIWRYNLKSKTVEQTTIIDKLSVFTDIAMSSNEKTIAVSGREGFLLLNADLTEKAELKGHTDWINDIDFSPDGKSLVSCSGTTFGTDWSVRIWNPESGQAIQTLEGHTNNVNTVDISPNGKLIVSASRDGSLKLWSLKDKKLVCTIVPLLINQKVVPFLFTPSRLYSGSSDFFKFDTVPNKSAMDEKGRKSAIKAALKEYF
jgi:WD40 repeat protein